MKNTMETPSEWQQSFQQTFYHRREWQIHAKGSKGKKKRGGGAPGTLSLASLLLRTGERKMFSRQAPSKAHRHQAGLLKKCYRDFLG